MPWRIYRPGVVVGDSRTGEMDKIDGPYYFFKLIQRMRQLLPPWMPTIGLEGGRINLVPVDFVVDALDHIAHKKGLDRRCFHLVDPEPKRVGEVLNIFAKAAHAPSMSLYINAALFGFVPRSVTKGLARTMLLLLPFVLLGVLVKPPAQEEMWSNDETDKVSTVLEHTQRGMLKPAEEASFQERMTNWAYLITDVIPYRPFGTGIGSGSLAELRFSNDAEELPPIDSSILLQGITCGFAGMVLFVWILFRSTWVSLRDAWNREQDPVRVQTKRIIAALMCALVVNSVFGLTFTLYSIAPLVWLFMGWVSVESMKKPEGEREVITI